MKSPKTKNTPSIYYLHTQKYHHQKIKVCTFLRILKDFLGGKITFLISAMISFGSLDEVVFMLHVNRNDLGLTSVPSFTALL